MASMVQFPTSPALLRRMEALRDLPRSRAFADFRGKVRGVAITGHRDGLLAGTDGRGRPLAPLAPSTLRYRKGTGPPLIPRGAASRFITNFRADWVQEGDVWVLVCRLVDVNDGRGRPFAQYHLTGTRHMPKRNVAGLRPREWAEIRRLHGEFIRSRAWG